MPRLGIEPTTSSPSGASRALLTNNMIELAFLVMLALEECEVDLCPLNR